MLADSSQQLCDQQQLGCRREEQTRGRHCWTYGVRGCWGNNTTTYNLVWNCTNDKVTNMKTQQGILLFNTPPHLPVPPKNGLLLSFLLKYYLKYWHRTYSSSDLTMILHFRNVSISLFSPLFSFRRIFSLISCLKSQRKIFRQEIVSIKKKLGLG